MNQISPSRNYRIREEDEAKNKANFIIIIRSIVIKLTVVYECLTKSPGFVCNKFTAILQSWRNDSFKKINKKFRKL